MQIEDYFNFLEPDDIRIRGTRVGIESVLDAYVCQGQSPEAIVQRYPTLTLEQVYATILYYLHNRESVGAYLADYLNYCEQAESEVTLTPTLSDLRRRLTTQKERFLYDS